MTTNMKDLNKILQENGIDPIQEQDPSVKEILDNTKTIMDDLFKTFGEIFGPQYHKDLKKNQEEADRKNSKNNNNQKSE